MQSFRAYVCLFLVSRRSFESVFLHEHDYFVCSLHIFVHFHRSVVYAVSFFLAVRSNRSKFPFLLFSVCFLFLDFLFWFNMFNMLYCFLFLFLLVSSTALFCTLTTYSRCFVLFFFGHSILAPITVSRLFSVHVLCITALTSNTFSCSVSSFR